LTLKEQLLKVEESVIKAEKKLKETKFHASTTLLDN
jgi:hypothetical protein